jgi:calcineurin-like phosphoesterase family protein
MGKVLVVGDVHGNTAHALWLLTVAREQGCDRVFALGDFGAWEHTAEGRRFFDSVEGAAADHGLMVYFLDGNHDKSSLLLEHYGDRRDDEGFLECRGHIRYAPRGHRWTWEDTAFAAFGGAYSTDKFWRLAAEEQATAFAASRLGRLIRRQAAAQQLWFPEEEMTDEELDTLLAADSSPVDVLLTHDKPRATNPEHNRKDRPECLPNQDRVQRLVRTLRPTMLLHGHLHYRYTETIEEGDRRTTVEGLAADPAVSDHPDYHERDSWLVLLLPVTSA